MTRSYRRRVLIDYLFGINEGKRVPEIIKHDPLVKYTRKTLMKGVCPFCGKKVKVIGSLVWHLSGTKNECGKRFNIFVDMTLERYSLFPKSYIHKVLEEMKSEEDNK